MNLSDSEIERLENGYPLGCDHLVTTSQEYNDEFYLWESRSDASDAENSVDAHAQSSQVSSPHSVPFGSPFSDTSLNAKMLRFNPQGKVHNTRSRTRVEQIKLEELRSGVRT